MEYDRMPLLEGGQQFLPTHGHKAKTISYKGKYTRPPKSQHQWNFKKRKEENRKKTERKQRKGNEREGKKSNKSQEKKSKSNQTKQNKNLKGTREKTQQKKRNDTYDRADLRPRDDKSVRRLRLVQINRRVCERPEQGHRQRSVRLYRHERHPPNHARRATLPISQA